MAASRSFVVVFTVAAATTRRAMSAELKLLLRCVQAGVALGLARMVGVRFPTWGPHFQTLAASIIIMNLCVGPPLFRAAIITMGESRIPVVGKPDHNSPQVVVRRPHEDDRQMLESRHSANQNV